MSRPVPSLRSTTVSLLAVMLLLGRLALDFHAHEHSPDEGGEADVCHACVVGGSPTLPAGALASTAPSPSAGPRCPRTSQSAVHSCHWVRPPYRGPPTLV